MQKTLQEIAEIIGGVVQGDGSVVIRGLAPVEHAEEGDISLVSSSRFDSYLTDSRASALIVYQDAPECDIPHIRVEKPDVAFHKAMLIFFPGSPAIHGGTRHGAAAAEMASVAPLLFSLVFEISEIGQASMVQQFLTNASGEAP